MHTMRVPFQEKLCPKSCGQGKWSYRFPPERRFETALQVCTVEVAPPFDSHLGAIAPRQARATGNGGEKKRARSSDAPEECPV
jgi:hypothetical protein